MPLGRAFVADLDDLLARDDIDAVTVTTATTRAPRARCSRRSGWKAHLHREASGSGQSTEAEEIIAAADQGGIALVVSSAAAVPRIHPGDRSTALSEERLGKSDATAGSRLSHDGAIAGWLPDRFYDPTGCRRRCAQ